MDQPLNAFDLSPEQQETKSLLQRLLGSAIASRYVDFCRLAAGAFALNVSRPLAAHALRELDSMIRGALEVPMEARAQVTAEDAGKIAKAREQLSALGFEEQVIDSAVRELRPRLNHKEQIRQIVSRLGLAPDGDIANLWTSLTETFGGAHQRSFHRSLRVDDDFRERYQRPFDTVIRGVAVALQGRYVALMRRVEQLAAMTDRKQAANLFAGEIPGALPLQQHFFERLQTADWLPQLAKQGLLGEPLAGPDEGASGGMRFRQWPAGNYLLRMAKSPDAVTRHAVAEAVRKVSSSKHPDVQYDGLEILAALPADESPPLADVAVAWLSPGTRNWPMQTPEALIKKLTQGGQRDAALKVARALLQIWEQNGHLVTHYAHHMYEHHLPSLVGPLAACCGEDALRLFADLLQEAARITKRIDSSHYSMRPIDDGMARHDVYETLISAVRRSAEVVIQADAPRMRGVVEFLAGYKPKIFVRLYLHVLASNPAAAPDLATAYLTDPSLIEASWCRDEYSSLALAWFPSLTHEDQTKVLGVIDAMPNKGLDGWKARFEEHMRKPPDAEAERKFRAAKFRDAVWKWRTALPTERQAVLDRIVQELGGPDAWKELLFPPQESPLRGTDFSSRPVAEIVSFLKSWRPEAEGSLHTVTALAQELRIAVANRPETLAIDAAQFAGLKPIYVREVLEGLEMAANNRRKFEWGGVLELIAAALGRRDEPINPATLFDGDDRDWSWASVKAAELLAAGLRQGAEGIAFEHADDVRSIVETLIPIGPDQPEIEDFEERYHREPFFAAQATLRGLAVELSVLLMFWLSKDPSSPWAAEPREALSHFPEIQDFFDDQLADSTPAGLKFDIGTDPLTGRRRTRYVSFKGIKRDAKLKLAALVAEHAAGTAVDPTRVTIADFLERWEQDWAAGNVSPKTLERYQQLTALYVIPRIGAVRLQKLLPAHLTEFYATLLREGGRGGRPLAARTVGHVHRLLHRALGHAAAWGLVVRNIASLVTPPRVSDNEELTILTEKQIGTVLQHFTGRTICPIVSFLLGTGCRRGEVLALRWKDIDWDNARVRIERSVEQTKKGLRFKSPKTKNSRRNIAVSPTLLAELHAHRVRQQEQRFALGKGTAADDSLVFARWDGVTRSPHWLTQKFALAMKDLGIDCTLHALRHTHVSQLIAGGMDVLTVSRRLGHASAAITLRVYGHLFSNTDARAAEIMEAFAKAFGGNPVGLEGVSVAK